MWMLLLRISIVVLGGPLGFFTGQQIALFPNQPMLGPALGTVAGALVGLLVVHGITKVVRDFNLKMITGALLGVLLGLILSNQVIGIVHISFKSDSANVLFNIFVGLCFAYFGGALGLRLFQVTEFSKQSGKLPIKMGLKGLTPKVLDTSALIDGRIADVIDSGFLEGILIIPQFVLKELQHIADSHDPLRRNRGRRGMEILKRLQESDSVKVKGETTDFPEVKEVDEKLVTLCSKIRAQLITTDFNLAQVANVQGIEVLNVNELANALRPVYLPGEEMEVFVLRQGKDPRQGVGYLEDGTMIVVEDGSQYIGKQVNMVVTSLLQTASGRMIFGRTKENLDPTMNREGYQRYLKKHNRHQVNQSGTGQTRSTKHP